MWAEVIHMEYIQIQLTPELKEQIQILAAAENCTVSEYITSFLEREIIVSKTAWNGYLATKTHGPIID